MKPTSILSVLPLLASLAFSAPVAELSNKEVGIDSIPESSKEPAAFLSPGAQLKGQNAEKRAQLAKRAVVVDVYADSNFNGSHEALTNDLNRCCGDGGCPSGGFAIKYLAGGAATVISSVNDKISSYKCD
ncbi:hypothetical protein B0O99DRAFT_694471 [Bisporella sp. PMI_857]|nr:hypothetical protein B0O99DRAFT_694471 [Bisporella sp. PMI_857]